MPEMTGPSLGGTLSRWTRKGSAAFADEFLFAGSHFVVQILLARWLSPESFGAVSVALAAYLVVAAVYNAVLCEPLLVFGSGRFASDLQRYVGTLLLLHAAVSGVLAALFGLAALGAALGGHARLAQALAGVAIAAPFMLLIYLFRRVYATRLRPLGAAIGGAAYLALVVAGLFAASLRRSDSPVLPMAALALAGAVVSAGFAAAFRPRWGPAPTGFDFRTVFECHWTYGKASVPTGLLTWFPVTLFQLLVPAWGGLRAAADLRTVTNLVAPVQRALTAASTLAIPVFVRTLAREGRRALARKAALGTAVCLAISGAYGVALTLFRTPVMRALYGDTYVDAAPLLPVGCLVLAGQSVTVIVDSLFRSIERPGLALGPNLLAAIAACTLGVWLVASRGLAGAVEGLVVCSAVVALAMVAVLKMAGPTAAGEGPDLGG